MRLLPSRTRLSAIIRPCIAGWICALLAFYSAHEAYGLQATVKRVVFEGPTRAEVVTLINDGDQPRTYRIALRRLRMTEQHGLEPVADSDIDSHPNNDMAGDIMNGMVRYSPRRITIPPGGTQHVRLMVRRPAGLANGEYRAHLSIEPEPELQPSQENDVATGLAAPQIALTIMTGLTMPVIVRQGALSASAAFLDVQISRKDHQYHATLTLTREGDRSLYGALEFSCIGKDGGTQLLERMSGIAIYTDVAHATMHFTLRRGADEQCHHIRLRYIGDAQDRQYGGKTLAEATVTPR